MGKAYRKLFAFVLAIVLVIAGSASNATHAQMSDFSQRHESARSDKFTGGQIEMTALEAGQPDIKITVDVPAFRLTLWQNGKEVKSYQIGVGRKEFPLTINELQATEIIWNPSWIPPDTDWVHESKRVKSLQVIKPGSPKNPLGKLKIPLGHSYLIHQAAKPTDLGNLVPHGCVRMLRKDIYDLAEKIIAAQALPVSPEQIKHAKQTRKTLVVALDRPLLVDINYDTQVIEGGVLHLYPDVYGRGTATVENLRAELESVGVDPSRLDDEMLKQMLSRPNKSEQFVVDITSIEAGRALIEGRMQPLVEKTKVKKQKAKGRRQPIIKNNRR